MQRAQRSMVRRQPAPDTATHSGLTPRPFSDLATQHAAAKSAPTPEADPSAPVAETAAPTISTPSHSFSRMIQRTSTKKPPEEREADPRNDRTAMPASLRSGVESLSGIDMSDVKVHYNSDKPAQLNARAYAQGTDIHLSSGQEKHLAHEAWHVVQQKQGRVQATTQMRGPAVNSDVGLEREAETMGSRALQSRAPAEQEPDPTPPRMMPVVQMFREPITPEGKAFVAALVEFFKKKDEAATLALNTAITKVDPSKEANKGFLDLFDMAKQNKHTDEAEKANVEKKTQEIELEISEEGANKLIAEKQESDEHGHALARHGPEVSNDLLERRLFTGLAPDDELSPAPGASSRFNSYKDVLETRQKAAAELAKHIQTVQTEVINWVKTDLPKLPQLHTDAQLVTQNAFNDIGKETKNKLDMVKLPKTDVDRGTKIQEAAKKEAAAKEKHKQAQSDEQQALNEKNNPGLHLKRTLKGKSLLELAVEPEATSGNLDDKISFVESYSITVDHGKAIGSGFSGTDVVKLEDVYNAVATNPSDADPTAKPIDDVKKALKGLGVSDPGDALAGFLMVPANLKRVKGKADKGGSKLFKTVTSAGDLTKSFTNLRADTSLSLFDDKDAPQTINPASWEAIQHFPAANDATDGLS